MEDIEDSVEPGIRVTKETEKWFLYLKLSHLHFLSLSVLYIDAQRMVYFY